MQKQLLNFVGDLSAPMWQGLLLVLALFGSQLFRNVFFSIAYVINLHTATRLQGALQNMVYDKVLRLRASDEAALSQVLTFCSSEQERIFDAIHMGTIIVGTQSSKAMVKRYIFDFLKLIFTLKSGVLLSLLRLTHHVLHGRRVLVVADGAVRAHRQHHHSPLLPHHGMYGTLRPAAPCGVSTRIPLTLGRNVRAWGRAWWQP